MDPCPASLPVPLLPPEAPLLDDVYLGSDPVRVFELIFGTPADTPEADSEAALGGREAPAPVLSMYCGISDVCAVCDTPDVPPVPDCTVAFPACSHTVDHDPFENLEQFLASDAPVSSLQCDAPKWQPPSTFPAASSSSPSARAMAGSFATTSSSHSTLQQQQQQRQQQQQQQQQRQQPTNMYSHRNSMYSFTADVDHDPFEDLDQFLASSDAPASSLQCDAPEWQQPSTFSAASAAGLAFASPQRAPSA